MCIGLWSLEHPDYALILCTNRDEYLSRPTANAHFHSFGTGHDDNYVLSGRDLMAGGSWFGINVAGRVALLTNICEPEDAVYRESRGHLVSSFLLPNAPDAEHLVKVLEDEGSTDYAGFNLLLLKPMREGEHGRLLYEAALMTNSRGHGTIIERELLPEERRAGAISNGADNADGRDWLKIKHGTTMLTELLYENNARLSEKELVDQLFGILLWQSDPPPANMSELHRSIHIPPFPAPHGLPPHPEANDWHDLCGTRLSTVLLVTRTGQVLFVERDVWKLDDKGNVIRGDPRDTRVFRFTLDEFKVNGTIFTMRPEGTQSLPR